MNNAYQDFFKKTKENAKINQFNVAPKAKVKVRSAKVAMKKRGDSKKMLILVVVGFIVTLGAFLYVDDLDLLLSKVEISFLSSARAEDVGAKPAAAKGPDNAKGDKNTEKKIADGAAVEGEQKDYSDTELNHFARLRERKNELDERENEIQKMEVEITKQKEELEKKMIALEEMRKKISSILEEKVQVDDKRIDNLVQFYSAMKPQQAAQIIESLDEGLAVEVLARMKKKSAADIMNLLKADKARIISEKYAGYRK